MDKIIALIISTYKQSKEVALIATGIIIAKAVPLDLTMYIVGGGIIWAGFHKDTIMALPDKIKGLFGKKEVVTKKATKSTK